MNFLQKTTLPCRRALIGALLALLLFAVPAGAAAKPRHGVTAAVVHRTLTITGDKHANKIALRVKRRAPNTLQVDAGDNGSADFSFKRRLFDRIVVRGGAGNDVLHVDERNRTRADNLALGRAGGLFRVTGTSRIDATSIERVELSTGSGADQVTIGDLTGTGVRQVSVDEGADADRLTVAGSPAADSFGLGRFGPFVHVQRDAQAIDAIHAERLDLEARGGADTLAFADLAGTDLRQLNLALGGSDGQSDNVVATGSDGADAIAVTGGFGVAITGLAPAVAITGTEPGDALTVDGRGGADSIDASGLPAGRMRLTLRGGPDADTLTGSPGDDTFRSAPGDGADTVDGKAGIDTAAMDGSSASDSFSAAANGSRAQLTRGPDGGAVDATGVERVDLNGLGGADASTVDNLAGTDVTQTTVDMGAGDGAADSAKVNGTAGADNVKLAGGGGGSVNVTGLGSTVSIANADPAADTLTVDTLAGNDSIHASDLAAGSAALRLIGGPGPDNLDGSAGDDTFVWNPGDESDILQGNQGADTLQFNGSDANETMSLSANGSRLAFFRDVGIVTQDAAGIERVDVNPIGGGDIIQVGNLSGTDVTQVGVDLAASDGGADGTADAVIVNGTPNPDRITVGGDASSIRVNAGQPVVSITRAEPAKDNLIVVGAAGADTVDASGLAAGAIGLVVNGGRDADVMIGSQGDDIFPWNPGDGSDTIEGQGGTDTMQFNGANVAEQIVVGANGSRVRFTRDVAGVTMDLAGVEHINFTARGGADRITVGDLSATDVTQTNLDISNGVGAGDGAADNVFVTGTNVSDTVNVSGSAGAAAVTGLHSSVSITGAEPANDRLTVSAENGDDVVEASGLAADAIALTENGGNGADVLIGGAGNDILHGDADDDVLNGGPGNDTLDGGTGNNILIQ